MFSQLRYAVESFSPQPRRGSVDTSENDSQGLSSTQLADSALSNLRKSLASQRSSSTRSSSPRPRGPGSQSLARSSNIPDSELRPPKLNLDDRLRAKFAIGEASNVTTPNVSGRASPAPVISLPQQQPLSPSLVPLPQSPMLQPQADEHISENDLPVFELLVPSQPQDLDQTHNTTTAEDRYVEADIPLPPDSPPNSPVIDIPAIAVPLQDMSSERDIDLMQQRLKLVEQRFADVSSSFKRLQAEKLAADSILRELTPVKGIADVVVLHDYLQNITLKIEISQDETKRLSGKITRQQERLEELRDTHRMESKSQSELIERLRRQVAESEAVLSVTQKSILDRDEDYSKRLADIDRLQAEVERSRASAKEEEEKSGKAISLLKTVRQKLVKVEKEKEDLAKEMANLAEKERSEKEKGKSEKLKFQQEIDAVNAERERAVVGFRAQFDKEIGIHKEKAEKELSALRSQFELDIVNMKSVQSRELATKNAQISALESSINTLSNDKNTLFYQLQLRQAELESSQTHADSLQSQNTELQYQLREMSDGLALLKGELAESRREQEAKLPENAISAHEMTSLLAAAETKYEVKIASLRSNLMTVEKERNESEIEWSRKLRDKTRESETLKFLVESKSKVGEQNDETVAVLKEKNRCLEEEMQSRLSEITALHLQTERTKQAEDVAKEQLLKLDEKTAQLEQQTEESKSREAQLRTQNKVLREELRKVQSSAALLERQRNPGVGYWIAKSDNNSVNDTRTSISSTSSESPSRTGSPTPASSEIPKNDEDINLEYLRNVILQFLEHKEMRPNLVRVLSIILRFTPQETRRLIAKV